MQELWQLLDEQGRTLAGKGASKQDVLSKGLLHGAAHVWIWRLKGGQREVLVQKRASGKQTWPDRYDVSAAGHISLGEDVLATALREVEEEIGLRLKAADARLVGVFRARVPTFTDLIENEFRWVYLIRLGGAFEFSLKHQEVASLEWKPLEAFATEVRANGETGPYVPQGRPYFEVLISALEAAV
jgi:isopentenyldiphosphate isomerase